MDKKFAIGDKVLFVNPDKFHVIYMDKYVGQVGVVEHDGGDDYNVKFDDGIDWFFDGTGLEAAIVAAAPIAPVKKEKGPFKFNIGDRVKVVAAKVASPQAGGYGVNMGDFVGKIFTVRSSEIHDKIPGYRLADEPNYYLWDERCLKRVRKAVAKAPVDALKPVKPQVGQEAIIEAPRPLVEAPKAIAEAVRKVRTTFKAGDEVVCVNGQAVRNLIQGLLYKLAEDQFQKAHPDGKWFVRVEGLESEFFIHRFRHAIVYYEGQQEEVAKAPIAPKVIEKKPSLLETLRTETRNSPGTCSYGKEFADGTFKMHIRDICHARIPTSADKIEVVKLALDVHGHMAKMDKGNDDEAYAEYVNYILNYSPWSSIFHHKGVDNALMYGILVDVDKPMYQVQGAAVALREGSEYSNKLHLFKVLLDKGYSGNTAYLLSSSVKGTLGALKFSGLDNQHKVLSGEQDAEKLFEFFRNGYAIRKGDKPYRTHNRHSEGIYKFIAPSVYKPELQINAVLRKGMGVKAGCGWDVDYKITDEAFFKYASTLETLLNKE